MVGRRLISAFSPLLIGTALWANGSVARPDGPSAPYKPLAVGTMLDYGDWSCEIKSSR